MGHRSVAEAAVIPMAIAKWSEAIPRTSAGKFKKSELRERFKDCQASE